MLSVSLSSESVWCSPTQSRTKSKPAALRCVAQRGRGVIGYEVWLCGGGLSTVSISMCESEWICESASLCARRRSLSISFTALELCQLSDTSSTDSAPFLLAVVHTRSLLAEDVLVGPLATALSTRRALALAHSATHAADERRSLLVALLAVLVVGLEVRHALQSTLRIMRFVFVF